MAKMRPEVRLKIKRIRLEEAADAVIHILEEHEKKWNGSTLKKSLLVERVPEAVHFLRKNSKGVIYIPTVENKQVAIASQAFVRNNWTEICLLCSQYGYFIIWNPKGETPGIRLGTLEEYEDQQSHLFASASGYARFHNMRSKIIESHGHDGTSINVELSKRRSERREENDA